MQTAHYPEVADDFGNWLAGFIDGEGCFQIAKTAPRRSRSTQSTPWWRLRLILRLRIDDKPIIDEIQRRTGLGRVRIQRRVDGSHAMADWTVMTKRDCMRLVALLERYPLRAKKRGDFEIWAIAVRAWQTKQGRAYSPADWSDIEHLAKELRAQRRIGLAEGTEAVVPLVDNQLRLAD